MSKIKNPDKDANKALNEEDQGSWDEYTKELHEESDMQEEEDFAALLDQERPASDRKGTEIIKTEVIESSQAKIRRQKQLKEAPQLDRRTEEKLRKGKLPIDGKIDLHGLTQDEAYEALNKFIESAVAADKRCVLVITGKGKAKSTSEDWLTPSQGVLKQRTPEWLSSPPLNHFVLKFFPAQPRHGGSGALYVYLKRRR